MSRLENAVSRTALFRMSVALVDGFIDSYGRAPKKIILDIDDTDDPTHGAQQQSLFNAYYDEYCFMPLHIYEGYSGKLIGTVLRPGKRPNGEEIATILKRVLKRIRQRWPKVRIVVRGDSHFSGPEIFDLCHSMRRTHFVLGLSNNRALKPLVEDAVQRVEAAYAQVNKKLKIFVEFPYQAKSWSKPQRVICKIEVSEKGRNVRFIVTDLNGKGVNVCMTNRIAGGVGWKISLKIIKMPCIRTARHVTGLPQTISACSCTVPPMCCCMPLRKKDCVAANLQSRSLIPLS